MCSAALFPQTRHWCITNAPTLSFPSFHCSVAKYREYVSGLSHENFNDICDVHWTPSELLRNLSSSKKIICSPANSLRHWIPCSIVLHISSCCTWMSSLQRYLSLILASSHCQRLRVSWGSLIPWPITTSWDSDHSCPASLPSRIVSLAAVSQMQRSLV